MAAGAVSDFELLRRCAEFTLSHSRKVEEGIIDELQTSAATPLVMGLRLIRLQRVVLAIGMFSLFEALLQSWLGWDEPFKRIRPYLEAAGAPDLAVAFDQYRLAVNVLKHGEGRSYQELLAIPAPLEFKVRAEGEAFIEEGDVSEVGVLVDVDEAFVQRCASLIEQVSEVIRGREPDLRLSL